MSSLLAIGPIELLLLLALPAIFIGIPVAIIYGIVRLAQRQS